MKFSWPWAFAIVAVASVANCSSKEFDAKKQEQLELKAWQATPEFAFRFCITTVAGEHGTATPEQIMACNKVAGRGL